MKSKKFLLPPFLSKNVLISSFVHVSYAKLLTASFYRRDRCLTPQSSHRKTPNVNEPNVALASLQSAHNSFLPESNRFMKNA